MTVWFWGDSACDEAARFAKQITEATVHVCHGLVLIEHLTRRKRTAVLAMRQGGAVRALDARDVEVTGYFVFPAPPRTKGVKAPPRRSVDTEALTRALSMRLGKPINTKRVKWTEGAEARVVTDDPASALAAMASVAEEMGTELNPGVQDVDAMGRLLRRLIGEVSG